MVIRGAGGLYSALKWYGFGVLSNMFFGLHVVAFSRVVVTK